MHPIHPVVEDEEEVVLTAFADAVEARNAHEAPHAVDEVYRLLQNFGTLHSIKGRQIQHLSVIGTRTQHLMESWVLLVKPQRRITRH